MKQIIRTTLATLGIISAVLLGTAVYSPAHIAFAAPTTPTTTTSTSAQQAACEAVNGAAGCTANGSDLTKLVKIIINVMSVVIGVVAVIMIMVAGYKYITSGGDTGKVTSAKNTLIYAIIGLIIVALSQFLVRVVLKQAKTIAANDIVASRVVPAPTSTSVWYRG